MRALILVTVLGLVGCQNEVHFMSGIKGDTGAPGTSCGVEQLFNGALIHCTDGTSAFISNGEKGEPGESIIGPQGPAGVSPLPGAYDIVGIVEPCAATNSEVLLRLRDGRLLAHYASGSAQYLALIGPGSYVLTDGGPTCHFTVGPAPTYSVGL